MNSKEDNQLERQLGSWKPRRPSRGLERRIFGADRVATTAGSTALRWNWMGPAAAVSALVLTLTLLQTGARLHPAEASPLFIAGGSLSNAELTAYSPGWVHSDRNGLMRDTFEWTNVTAAPSTRRSLPVMLSMTNSLFE